MSDSEARLIHLREAVRCGQLAALAVLVFDHVITFNLELDIIWGSKWSMGKVIFILNRYGGLISIVFSNCMYLINTPSDTFCLRFLQWQGWTGLVAYMLPELLLQFRIYALWRLNKKILCLLLISFIATSATAATIMGTTLSGLKGEILPLTGDSLCAAVTTPSSFFTFWIPPLVFESLLCTLAIIRAAQSYMVDGSSFFRSARNVAYILVRDSVLYYVVVFTTYLTCLLMWLIAGEALLEVPIGFSVVMSCVMANRLILNLRIDPEKPQRTQTIEMMMSFHTRDGVIDDVNESYLPTSRM